MYLFITVSILAGKLCSLPIPVFISCLNNRDLVVFRKEMGRFKKHCSNVLHSNWCQQSENVSVKFPTYR